MGAVDTVLLTGLSPQPAEAGAAWMRRARPLLGTLVEVGVPAGHLAAATVAFEAVARVQSLMSVFDPHSEVSCFNRADAAVSLSVSAWTADVLALSQDLCAQTGGRFDVARGSGRWRLESEARAHAHAPHRLIKLDESARIDLGGIAKGYAVDRALEAALQAGAPAAWVNAGGDLRCHGVSLAVSLRDEHAGGTRPFVRLSDGAMASSFFGPGARSQLYRDGAQGARAAHVSVAAPRCAWADALTKVVALMMESEGAAATQAVLARYHARAWLHS